VCGVVASCFYLLVRIDRGIGIMGGLVALERGSIDVIFTHASEAVEKKKPRQMALFHSMRESVDERERDGKTTREVVMNPLG
jgi:hypothetical protein